MLLRCLVPTALAAVVCLSFTPPAAACPGCGPPSGQTLTNEVAQADFILYGTLSNAKPDPKDPGSTKGTTDITIDSVVKEHALVKDKKVFTIPRFVPPDPKPFKYMVFFNVVNGDVDPYRGVVVGTDSKLPEYVKGALAVKQKDVTTRLRYFFDYLESNEIEISGDAYNEFAVATYQEVKELAPKLPFETLMKWLKDPNTRSSRLGLYGMLVGHSGKAEYAKEVRALIDAPESKSSSGLDGLLMGYILLDKKNGYDYLMKLVADKDKEFLIKHSALKTLRFFWEYRPDVLTRKQLLDGMSALLDHPDIADMPIDDLRKWKAWELNDAVLKLADKESHNTLPINRRAILKFALAASWADPKNTAAAAHVEKVRKDQPDRVQQVEDLLKDEMKVAPKPPEPPKK
ncbi:hypothetical protein VT84_10140 [Gemmata sp. SH-PL17]|uniref:hypothetical protein n=1 Tax=Gemmata sp. SH-PL17 TaxID=1630693 RepID=UPI00078D2C36|nr:hypothetical protein [Gemmata sp. SH-PL17]AMV24745.1 hypothetical protein VT84_10140 [Gemmata sp. SH-PL17]